MRSLEVNQVFNLYPPECQPARAESLGCAGGMSGAQFWRVATSRATLCLRRWPIEHPSPQRLTFIHAIIQHAARNGITFIPVPITTRSGESFVPHAGHLWQLEPWMPGSADYERAQRVEKLRAAMSALAQFHIATSDFKQSAPGIRVANAELTTNRAQPALPRRLAQLRELLKQGTSDLSRAIDGVIWPELAPLARQFMAFVPKAARAAIEKLEPLASVRLPLQPCLRDIWHDHILFTGDQVTGIIDFGAVDIDMPAGDIARLLGSLVGDEAEGWQTCLAAYSAVRPLTPEELLAASALDQSGTVLAGCNWIRWIYLERREFDNQVQVIDRFRRILARLLRCD